uniref:Zip-domain-containing protein n=1 Tax=Panagrellus redivivus TaxID=6233 RepID=A0A7E4ZXE6_PANRE
MSASSRRLGLLALALVAAVVFVQGHSHEAPHLKYTREVNEQAAEEVSTGKVHSHLHDHGHEHHAGCGHDHGHDHDHVHDHHDHDHAHAHDHHHDHEEIHVHSHGGHHHHHAAPLKEKFVPYPADSYLSFLNDPKTRLWTYAIGSVLLISAFPCFILAFIPIQANTSESSSLLKVLLAFGAGGLLGDAFLHLIPHASGGHDHGHGHGHDHGHSHEHSHGEEGHDHSHDMSTGFWVLGGLLTFFIVEKFVRIVRGEDDHHHGHSHGHSHGPVAAKKPNSKSQAEESDDEKSEASVKKDKALKNRPTKKDGDKKKVAPAETAPVVEAPRIRVAAYLNLAADFMHNFTDGLAIGASFIAGSTVGLVTTVTVLFHEVPHEIGDFAILIQSGYSKKRAMFTQLLTALGALFGCVISLWSVDASALAEAAQSSWVLPFTAGGFIYIATVSVLPELLEKSSLLLSIFEVVAISAGVFAMYLVALFE